jgi:predicted DNA-binding transcriptional regulator AlpA
MPTDNYKPVRWLRKRTVAARYGVGVRSIDRAVKENRFPKPGYPFGTHTPLWLESELDAHDAMASKTAAA